MTMLTNSNADTTLSFHEDDDDFLQSSLRGMAKCESEWQAAGAIYSWIDPYPAWVSAGDWSEYLGDGFPRDPLKPCRRIIRFSLIGGGQIRVTEQWTDKPLYDGATKEIRCELDPKLHVSAHTDQGLRRYSGHLSYGAVYEMATHAVASIKIPRRTLPIALRPRYAPSTATPITSTPYSTDRAALSAVAPSRMRSAS
jgi:hypothetical protein